LSEIVVEIFVRRIHMMQLVQDWYIAREVDRDESLTQTLMEWFSHRPALRDVTVFVLDGVATLRGSVASNRDRALAIELAWDAGADDIQDDLKLTRPLAA
jgi:osmotically-inducible protein OsmY